MAGRSSRTSAFELRHSFVLRHPSFVISPRLQDYFNAVEEGWVALWCEQWGIPEAALHLFVEDAGSARPTPVKDEP